MAGEGGAVAWPLRSGEDADHDLVVVELLERDVRGVPRGPRDLLAEARLDLARRDRRREPRAKLDPLRLAKGDHRELEEDAVRDHDPVGAVDEGGVEEPERADDPLDIAGHGPAAKPDPLADPERAGGEQHQAGEEVAERLLGGEPDEDRRERPAE